VIILTTSTFEPIDTVATLAAGSVVLMQHENFSRMIRNPLAAIDQVMLFAGGWIALAFADPYRVDWIRPDGARIHGPALAFERIRGNHGEMTAALRRSRIPEELADALELPEYLPAILPGRPAFNFDVRSAVVGAPDGRLLVRRTQPARFPGTRFDVIDRRGGLVGFAALASNQNIVGSGEGLIYIATTDSVGIQRLHTRAWPTHFLN
jgi:hypothetical protein